MVNGDSNYAKLALDKIKRNPDQKFHPLEDRNAYKYISADKLNAYKYISADKLNAYKYNSAYKLNAYKYISADKLTTSSCYSIVENQVSK